MLPAKAKRRLLVTGGAEGVDQFRRIDSTNNLIRLAAQAAPIRAEMTGSDQCSVANLTARGSSPVLQLCGRLVEAGIDPGRALFAYRGDVLALIVPNIGKAAGLTVKSAGNGGPMFAVDRTKGGAPAPTVRKSYSVLSRSPLRLIERGGAP